MGRTRSRQRVREEEPIGLEEIEVNPEEVELSDFLDGLGPQGISEVSLYRVLPSGKQRFIRGGPPSQFSEQYVQVQFGEGDYLARAKLNGRWYKSKSFSVEAAPGTVAVSPSVNSNHDGELERLKAQIESQRLEMERDRQAREQRNHELQLKMLEALGGSGDQSGTSLTELIAGVEALRNLSGNGVGLAGFKEVVEIADRISALRGDSGREDSWFSILKSLAPEMAQAATQILMARNASLGATAGPAVVPRSEAKSEVGSGTANTISLPTAIKGLLLQFLPACRSLRISLLQNQLQREARWPVGRPMSLRIVNLGVPDAYCDCGKPIFLRKAFSRGSSRSIASSG